MCHPPKSVNRGVFPENKKIFPKKIYTGVDLAVKKAFLSGQKMRP
jgi:hypothetical protein